MTKYYLNNMTENELTITLTANRTVKPLSSLPLNDKDVEIYKALKQARAGVPSLLDGLVFSTIPIEEDSRYCKAMEIAGGKEVEQQKQKDNANEDKAKPEADEQAKADEDLKAKLRQEIEKQAKKEKRDFAEGDLDREVEEAFKKVKEQAEGQN